MAYAVYQDIQSEFKNLNLDDFSALTAAEITAFIAEEEAVINAAVSNRYEIPVNKTPYLS